MSIVIRTKEDLAESNLTLEIARDLLDYNPNTGIITWKRTIPRTRIVQGREAGGLKRNKCRNVLYKRLTLCGIIAFSHRWAWFLYYGSFPEHQIDHIDGNGLNNRITNLREVSAQENAKNVTLRKDNASGYPGIAWYPPLKKWHARIRKNKMTVHLGYFETLQDAVAARRSVSEKFGYHVNHGRALMIREVA